VKARRLRGTLPAMTRAGPFWLIALAGCGSDPVPAPADEPVPMVCDDGPGYSDDSVLPQHVGPVSARLLDTDGAPAAEGLLVQVCGVNVGANVCVNGEVRADGLTSVPTDHDIPKPAFKYGDGLVYGKVALLLPEPSDNVELDTLHVPLLPAVGAPVRGGATAESGGVRLVVDAGTTVEFDLLIYRTPEDQAFRARELPPEQFPALLDQGAGIELVFTLAPLETTLCPAAALEVPNSAGWEPGTQVEFLLQGLDIDRQPWAPYGAWAVFAEGEVEASGERIVTIDGGLPVVSNVGVRRR